MVANAPPTMVAVPLAEAVEKTKPVPLDSDSILTARDLGVSFGDD
jgi:6-phosphofructokinase 1